MSGNLANGERVAAFGVCQGIYKAAGKSMRAAFAHLDEVRDGKIRRIPSLSAPSWCRRPFPDDRKNLRSNRC